MSPERIISTVSALTGVAAPAITGKRRTARVSMARTIAFGAMNYAYDWWSQQELAESLGKKCHGTGQHALKSFAKNYERCPRFRAQADEVFQELFQTTPDQTSAQ